MANYCSVDEQAKQHILNLLIWIEQEVLSSGGDGDAAWFSRFYSVNDIAPILVEYNKTRPYPWKVLIDGDKIHWGENQEWAFITNNEEDFNGLPEWVQAKIRW